MNKYSKRALKTTATVGMSLAMVLSAAAPVMAAAVDAAGGVCNAIDIATTPNDVTCGKLVFVELAGKNIADFTMEDKKVAISAAKKVDYFTAVSMYGDALTAYKATANVSETKEIAAWEKAVTKIEAMYTGVFATTADITNDEVVATNVGIVKTVATNVAKTGTGTDTWTAVAFADKTNGSTNLEAARAELKKMNDLVKDGYDLNMTAAMQTVFEDARMALEDEVNTYLGDTKPADLADFVITWEKILKFDLANEDSTLDELDTDIITSGEVNRINLSSKSALNARIKAIKDHDFYTSFKDEEAVVAIVEAYEELIANIDGNKDLTKTDSYKAYVTEKTDDANKTAKDAIKAMPKAADNTDAKKADAIAADIDNEQFEALKAYKEDVLDEVVTMATRKIGNYHIEELTWSKTISKTVQNTVKNNLIPAIYTLVDTKDGLFGYDVIVNHMEDFNAALEAATTDIEKITPANIKASDKAKLEAAEDALYELTNEKKGAYVNNLTDKEARSLRAAERKIENLREAFDNLGTTTATGWYDKGNGNWGYNNEDGTAATKWVAAGSDWYYVKGGNMLRNAWVAQDASGAKWYYVDNAGKMVSNTTIDGFVIDANGVWTK